MCLSGKASFSLLELLEDSGALEEDLGSAEDEDSGSSEEEDSGSAEDEDSGSSEEEDSVLQRKRIRLRNELL